MDPDDPDAVVEVRATEPEPCVATVEAVTLVGMVVETTSWLTVETGVWAASSLAILSKKQF